MERNSTALLRHEESSCGAFQGTQTISVQLNVQYHSILSDKLNPAILRQKNRDSGKNSLRAAWQCMSPAGGNNTPGAVWMFSTPLYSHDLTSCNYHIFRSLRKPLCRLRFTSDDEVKEVSRAGFTMGRKALRRSASSCSETTWKTDIKWCSVLLLTATV